MNGFLSKCADFQASSQFRINLHTAATSKSFVFGRIFFEIGQRQLEQRGGGTQTVFLQMDKAPAS